jgi:hypothetical protein
MAAAAVAAANAYATESGAAEEGELPEWLELAAKLPASRGDRAMRGQLFDGIWADVPAADRRDNALTTDQLENGLLSTLGVPSSSAIAQRCNPAINRAVEMSQEMRAQSSVAPVQGAVDRADFRLVIAYMRRYLELLATYRVTESGEARQLDADAFEAAVPTLLEWGVSIDEPADALAAIPGYRNGSVPFDAFCDWALGRGLEPLVADADEEGASRSAEAAARSPSPAAKRSPSPAKKSPSPTKKSPSPAKKAVVEMSDRPANGTSPAPKTAAKTPKSKAVAPSPDPPSVQKLTLPVAGFALKEDTSQLASQLHELTEETNRTPRSRGYTRYLAGMRRLEELGAVPSPDPSPSKA